MAWRGTEKRPKRKGVVERKRGGGEIVQSWASGWARATV